MPLFTHESWHNLKGYSQETLVDQPSKEFYSLKRISKKITLWLFYYMIQVVDILEKSIMMIG